MRLWDFPGGPVVKNLPSNAGHACSIPGRGTKIPHTEGQLSRRAPTTEPVHSGARTLQRRAHSLQRKIPSVQLRPNTAK